MEDKIIIKEIFLSNSLEPISIEQTKNILYQMEKCVCKYLIKVLKEQDFFQKFHINQIY